MSGKHRHRRHQESLEHKLRDVRCTVTTTHRQIKDLAYHKFHVDPDRVVCGYLRQPIHLHEGHYDVVVEGMCALKENYCQYSVSQNRLYQIGTCEAYVKRFGKEEGSYHKL